MGGDDGVDEMIPDLDDLSLRPFAVQADGVEEFREDVGRRLSVISAGGFLLGEVDAAPLGECASARECGDVGFLLSSGAMQVSHVRWESFHVWRACSMR